MTCTDMVEGMAVLAIKDVKDFTVKPPKVLVSLGSGGVIEKILWGGFAAVRFADCQTGESVRSDVISSEVEKVGGARAWPRQERKTPSCEYEFMESGELDGSKTRLGGTR